MDITDITDITVWTLWISQIRDIMEYYSPEYVPGPGGNEEWDHGWGFAHWRCSIAVRLRQLTSLPKMFLGEF